MPSKKKTNTNDSSHEFKFKKDEKILVLPTQHSDDIYEAKVLDRKLDKSKEPQYKIHYKGWNKRWDEWVDSRRLLKINPSNLQIMNEKKAQTQLKQQQLQQLQEEEEDEDDEEEDEDEEGEEEENEDDDDNNNNNNNNDEDDDDDDDVINNNNNNRKRKIRRGRNGNNKNKKRRLNAKDDDNKIERERVCEIVQVRDREFGRMQERVIEEEEEERVRESEGLEIKLPTQLKRKLIKDWENITKKSQLISLPRRSGVRIFDILTDFESFAISSGQDKNIVLEISRGIKDYFNQALQVTLLYKLERNQYHQIIKQYKHLSMDQIYGVEHLCRLFVKLPQLLSPNDLDIDTKQILKQQIKFIIDFILSNESKYFDTNYIIHS